MRKLLLIVVILSIFACKPAPPAELAEEIFKSGVILSFYSYYGQDKNISGISRSENDITFTNMQVRQIIPESSFNTVDGLLLIEPGKIDSRFIFKNDTQEYELFCQIPYTSLEEDSFESSYWVNGHKFLYSGAY